MADIRTDHDDGTDHDLTLEEAEIDLSDIKWDDTLVLLVFWVLAFVVFLQFFTRYVLNDSLGWTEEIARFLLIAVTFTGSIMAVRKNSHIAVEFLYRWVPRPLRRVAQSIIDLINVVFFGGLAYLSSEVAGRTRQMMVSIDVSKSIVYWFVAACFLAMTLYALRNAWVHLRDGTSKLIDPELHASDVPTME